MAISPGIPTSFVPKQPVQPVANRPMRSSNNVFLIVSLVIFAIVAVLAAGTFAYDRYLTHELATKKADLATAQSKVDENTIEEFVRLRDRLSNGESLLTNNVTLSQFFDVLENLTLQNVRFNSMKLVVANDHTATIDITGTAKNFNTLAAQSNAFATEKRIKRAIFSAITLTQDKLVGFRLTADLDPKIVVAGSGVNAAGAPIQTQPSGVTLPASTTQSIPLNTATTTTAKPGTTQTTKTASTTTQ